MRNEFDFNSNVSFGLASIDSHNNIIIDDGTIIKLNNKKSVVNWILSSHIHILYANNNILDSIIACILSHEEIKKFLNSDSRKIGIDGYILSYGHPRNNFTFSKRNDKHRIIQFAWGNEEIKTLEELQKIYNSVKNLVDIDGISIAESFSPQDSVRLTYMKSCKEYSLNGCINDEILSFAQESVYGGRFDIACNGIINGYNIDLISAHPNIAKHQKRIGNNIIVTCDNKYSDEFDYNFYLVDVKIPPRVFTFNPIPVRKQIMSKDEFYRDTLINIITYPHGELNGIKIPGPIMDIVHIFLGPNYYKIHKAFHIRCLDEDYNQKEFCEKTIKIIGNKNGIDSRRFLYSAFGSMNRIESPYYNPIKYSHITAETYKRVYMELSNYSENSKFRFSSDGYSVGKKPQFSEISRVKGSGQGFLYSPVLSDDPGSSIYRDAVEKHPDSKGIRIYYSKYPTLEDIYLGFSDIEEHEENLLIPPSCGYRIMGGCKDIRIGELLYNNFPSESPDISAIDRMNIKEDLPLWLRERAKLK